MSGGTGVEAGAGGTGGAVVVETVAGRPPTVSVNGRGKTVTRSEVPSTVVLLVVATVSCSLCWVLGSVCSRPVSVFFSSRLCSLFVCLVSGSRGPSSSCAALTGTVGTVG